MQSDKIHGPKNPNGIFVRRSEARTMTLKLIMKACFLVPVLWFCLSAQGVLAKDQPKLTAAQKRTQHLENYTQSLKKDVIKLGRFLSDLAWVGSVRTIKGSAKNIRSKNALSRDLLGLGQTLTKLEDGLLTPPGFQLIVFVSLDTSRDFSLQQINLEIDGKMVHSRKYTRSEMNALHLGGAHRLFIANMPEGKHKITAYYLGGTDGDSQYQGKKSLTFNKDSDRKTIEFRLSSLIGKPRFTAKERD